MTGDSKRNVIGVLVDAIDYDGAMRAIARAAAAHQPFAVTALAVHGVMTGYTDEEHRARLNQFDLVVPDGQPVRWALNLLHGEKLKERVYGPNLMLRTCDLAEQNGWGMYLYGSTAETLTRLETKLRERFPRLIISGAEPSRFRSLSDEERAGVIDRIRSSGAGIVLVGLGCPRQEVWAFEYRDALSCPILAVGAAFAFHAGSVSQAPRSMQRFGLEWLYRLRTEPRRLWKRYLLLNPWYATLVAAQALRVRRFPETERAVTTRLSPG